MGWQCDVVVLAGLNRGLPTRKCPGVRTGFPSVGSESSRSSSLEFSMDSAMVRRVVSCSKVSGWVPTFFLSTVFMLFPASQRHGSQWRELPGDVMEH